MDRLVSVNVEHLDLNFRPSLASTVTFTVTNLMHTMSVAVHLSLTRPHLFSLDSVTPRRLPPLSSAVFTLTLLPLSRPPPVISPPDRLFVKSAILPISNPNAASLHRLFSLSAGAHVFKDAAIPISLVGPHLLDALLLSSSSDDDQTLDSAAFSISRAIAACSSDELSSLLRRSAAAGRPGFASMLINTGADVDARGSDGRSALSLAVSSANLDAVRVLVDAGARIDPARDRVFNEAAGANRTDIVSVLEKSRRLGSGWAGSFDSGGRTPVHYAAANGHLDAVRVCLDSGDGDPDQPDLAGWTPLHCAAYGGFLDVVEFLIQRSRFNSKLAVTLDAGHKTPLNLAQEARHVQLYDVLGFGDRFLRAASVGDMNGVKECTSRSVDVNLRDQNGWTALHRAAFKGRFEIARLLIENGGKLYAVDDRGFTPLRCAMEAGHVELALLLVRHGAQARLKGFKAANLFSMKLDSCGVNASNLFSLIGDVSTIET